MAEPTFTLGLGGSNHDFSACLVEDGAVRFAIEEERLNRVKYSVNVNSMFAEDWRYCLEARGIDLDDVAAVVADDALLPTAYFKFRSRVELIRHHHAHACSTFYPSPFERAAIMIVDGAGSLVPGHGVETMTMAVGSGTTIEELRKVYGANYTTDGMSAHRIYQAGDSDHSLGFMYKAVSREIGFALYEEGDWYLTEDGKTMGLAPYGSDRYVADMRRFMELTDDGRFTLHLHDGGLLDYVAGRLEPFDGEQRMEHAADLAFAAQQLLEDAMIHAARQLHEDTGSTSLCLAGGVALNCVANGRVLRETPFDDVYVQPAAGDAGCAVGSALHGYHGLLGRPRTTSGDRSWTKHAYYGRSYPSDDVVAAIEAAGLPYEKVDDAPRLAAHLLADGALLGWYTGASEFGPRALGHRSILADPRDPTMKDQLNARVKHREDFRPFAPAVLLEHAPEYFELDIEAPFMLVVAPVRDDKRSVIPAVTHVDGTARVQTVTAEANDRFHSLIECFHELTTVPVVLNTSFNDRGEPIVERPSEAVAFFGPSELDYLVMDDFVVGHDEAELRLVVERVTSGV